jgi:aspartyl protease family protein
MALSSGGQRILVDSLSWIGALGMCALGIVYFSEIRAFTRDLVGIPHPEAQARAGGTPRQQPVRAAGMGSSGPTVELVAGDYGHFHAKIDVNGRSIDALVDTGASMVALTYEDARRIGIFVKDSDYDLRTSTANGTAKAASVRLSTVDIGGIRVRNVDAAVMEPGKMNKSLLGMAFLGRLQRVEMGAGRLKLVE